MINKNLPYLNKTKIEDINNTQLYYKKIIKPSPDEIELHKKFLKTNLKKNFF